MNQVLNLGLVALLSCAAGGCCCLRQPCPDPCPPPACPAPCAPAMGAPVIPSPGGTYAPIAPLSMQGGSSRSDLAGSRGQGTPTGGPMSTVFETLRSWTSASPVSGPARTYGTAPARPLAVTQ